MIEEDNKVIGRIFDESGYNAGTKNWRGLTAHFTDSCLSSKVGYDQMEEIRSITDYMLKRGIPKEDINKLIYIVRYNQRQEERNPPLHTL